MLTDDARPEPMPTLASLADADRAVLASVVGMLAQVRKLAPSHRTAWLDGPISRDDQPLPQRMLMFVTLDPNAYEKAKAALDAAGVLCDMDVGGVVTDGNHVVTRDPPKAAP